MAATAAAAMRPSSESEDGGGSSDEGSGSEASGCHPDAVILSCTLFAHASGIWLPPCESGVHLKAFSLPKSAWVATLMQHSSLATLFPDHNCHPCVDLTLAGIQLPPCRGSASDSHLHAAVVSFNHSFCPHLLPVRLSHTLQTSSRHPDAGGGAILHNHFFCPDVCDLHLGATPMQKGAASGCHPDAAVFNSMMEVLWQSGVILAQVFNMMVVSAALGHAHSGKNFKIQDKTGGAVME
eukprot:1156505-Pelagomonas_calceolata.AAC.11